MSVVGKSGVPNRKVVRLMLCRQRLERGCGGRVVFLIACSDTFAGPPGPDKEDACLASRVLDGSTGGDTGLCSGDTLAQWGALRVNEIPCSRTCCSWWFYDRHPVSERLGHVN
jgi:hypothetical protein